PLKGKARPGKTSWRNFATWPLPGTGMFATGPAEAPSSPVSSRVTVVCAPSRFAMAKPVWMAPMPPSAVSSAYIRNADPWIPGTPASETVIAPGLYENTTSDDGDAPVEDVTRTEPATVDGSSPAVTSLNELCRGML